MASEVVTRDVVREGMVGLELKVVAGLGGGGVVVFLWRDMVVVVVGFRR